MRYFLPLFIITAFTSQLINAQDYTYSTRLFEDGSKYTGDFLNGEIHGSGLYEFANGTVYEGEFAYGLIHGYGTMYYISGEVYEGRFHNGHNGKDGILTKSNGDKFRVHGPNETPIIEALTRDKVPEKREDKKVFKSWYDHLKSFNIETSIPRKAPYDSRAKEFNIVDHDLDLVYDHHDDGGYSAGYKVHKVKVSLVRDASTADKVLFNYSLCHHSPVSAVIHTGNYEYGPLPLRITTTPCISSKRKLDFSKAKQLKQNEREVITFYFQATGRSSIDNIAIESPVSYKISEGFLNSKKIKFIALKKPGKIVKTAAKILLGENI